MDGSTIGWIWALEVGDGRLDSGLSESGKDEAGAGERVTIVDRTWQDLGSGSVLG